MRNLEFDEFDIRSYNTQRRPSIEVRCYSGGSSGGQSTSTPQATPEQIMALYNTYLPTALATTTNQVAPVTNAMAGAAAGANPMYTAGTLNQLNSYAPGYSNAGNLLAQQQALGQADLLSGAGGLYALEGAGLTNLLNPAQAASNTQAANLVNSINLNGLTGGETAAVERSLNQSNTATGNLGIDNATNAVANAMNFGQALQAKRAALGQALGAAQGIAQAQNTAFNPTTAIASASNPSNNFGLTQFNPTQANQFLTTPFSFGSSFGNQLAGIGAASRTTSSSGSTSGGCFLTTVCCQYKGLPDNCEELNTLRAFRDSFVPQDLVDEYYKVAPTIAEKVKGQNDELQRIWNIIQKCLEFIKKGDFDAALDIYRNMVNKLKLKYVNV